MTDKEMNDKNLSDKKTNMNDKKMNDKKSNQTVDVLLLIGLLLFAIYSMINRFFVTIPDPVAYPWIIISCICMLVGLYRSMIKLVTLSDK